MFAKGEGELTTFMIERPAHKLVGKELDYNNEKVSRRASGNCGKLSPKIFIIWIVQF